MAIVSLVVVWSISTGVGLAQQGEPAIWYKDAPDLNGIQFGAPNFPGQAVLSPVVVTGSLHFEAFSGGPIPSLIYAYLEQVHPGVDWPEWLELMVKITNLSPIDDEICGVIETTTPVFIGTDELAAVPLIRSISPECSMYPSSEDSDAASGIAEFEVIVQVPFEKWDDVVPIKLSNYKLAFSIALDYSSMSESD